MIEYHNLRLEYLTNYKDSKVTKNLAILLSNFYHLDTSKTEKIIQKIIEIEQNSPVLFFRKLEKKMLYPRVKHKDDKKNQTQ